MKKQPQSESPKIATSFRLSQEAIDLLEALTEDTGLGRSGVLEMAIRWMAYLHQGMRVGQFNPDPAKTRDFVAILQKHLEKGAR